MFKDIQNESLKRAMQNKENQTYKAESKNKLHFKKQIKEFGKQTQNEFKDLTNSREINKIAQK